VVATKAESKPADDAAATKKAAASIQKAQVELARVEASAADDPAVAEGRVLLASAVSWFDKRSFAEADDLAGRAFAALSKVRARPAAAAKPPVPEATADACAEAKRIVEESKEAEKGLSGRKLPEAEEKARAEAKADLGEGEKRVAKKACGEALPLLNRAKDTFTRLARPAETKPPLGQKPWEAALTAIQDAEKA